MKKITYEEFLERQKKAKKSKSKYKNRSMWVNGYVFHSTLEGNRYKQLLLLEKNGLISFLELQPKFVMQDTQKVYINDKLTTIKKYTYSADFRYMENGLLVIEDVKGVEVQLYKANKKMFLANHEYDVFREFKSKRKIIDYRKEG